MSHNDITGDKIATKAARLLARLFKHPPEPQWLYSEDGYTRAAGGVVERLVTTGWSEYWERVTGS